MLSKLQGYEYCGVDLNCKLTTSIVDGEEEIGYTTYGIIITNRSGETVISYEDISTNREFVERFISMCDECGAAGTHVVDILEDYLA